jgi:hypothetical protein
VTNEQPYIIHPWRQEHDATAFSSGIASTDRYIKEQTRRGVASHASLVFVLTEPGRNVVGAYYTGKKPRLGELLLVDAQKMTLRGAVETAGTAMMVIDAEQPTAEEAAKGIRDPLDFYTQYGFLPFPGHNRRVFKLVRVIEKEFAKA